LFLLINEFKTLKVSDSKKLRDTEQITATNVYRNLTWPDYEGNAYDLNVDITVNEARRSTDKKNSISVGRANWTSSEAFWGSIYRQLLETDKDFIAEIADSLSLIRAERSLNTAQFADVIMTFVQDIDYSFVFEDYRCYSEPNSPCVEGQKFGIHSPTEFLYTLKGDCDTRAVLLMGVFKKLGYDPAIAVSDAYAHAMLLLSLPSSGDYLTRFNKKYYFWETTAKNWKLGVLPPTTSNINKWKIVL